MSKSLRQIMTQKGERPKMRRIFEDAYHKALKGCTDTAQAVYKKILMEADYDYGGSVYLSDRQILQQTGIRRGPATIRKALRELEDKGLIRRLSASIGRSGTSEYAITFDYEGSDLVVVDHQFDSKQKHSDSVQAINDPKQVANDANQSVIDSIQNHPYKISEEDKKNQTGNDVVHIERVEEFRRKFNYKSLSRQQVNRILTMSPEEWEKVLSSSNYPHQLMKKRQK